MGYTLGNGGPLTAGGGNGKGNGGSHAAVNGKSAGIQLHRTPLREQIRSILRDWLVSGQLPPGEDLNEREIGDRLGSSRTPVREALLLLAVEGLVSVHPHEGYYVANLSRDEGEDLYGLLGHIERRALQRAGIPSEEELSRLEALDRERRESQEPTRRMELDREWHATLLPRERIGQVYGGEIERLKNRAARYELSFLEDDGDQTAALAEHRVIVATLRNGDLGKAGRLLEEHWLHGAEYAARWPRGIETSGAAAAP